VRQSADVKPVTSTRRPLAPAEPAHSCRPLSVCLIRPPERGDGHPPESDSSPCLAHDGAMTGPLGSATCSTVPVGPRRAPGRSIWEPADQADQRQDTCIWDGNEGGGGAWQRPTSARRRSSWAAPRLHTLVLRSPRSGAYVSRATVVRVDGATESDTTQMRIIRASGETLVAPDGRPRNGPG
jgi:hypothetical protein